MFRAVSSVMCVLVAQSAAKHLRSIDSAGSIPPEVQIFCSFDTEHLIIIFIAVFYHRVLNAQITGNRDIQTSSQTTKHSYVYSRKRKD